MTQDLLNQEDAYKLLESAIARAFGQIEAIRMSIPDSPEMRAWQDTLSEDWAMGKAYNIVSHRGAAAAPILESDRNEMRAAGRTEGEIAKCETNVGLLVQSFEAPPTQGPNAPGYRLMKEALGRDRFSQAEVNHGRRLMFRGRGAAFLVASKGDLSDIGSARQEALALAGANRKKEASNDVGPVCVTPRPSLQNVKDEPEYDPMLSAVVDRLMEQKRRRRMSPQMIDQMTKVFLLFEEATGVSDIRKLRQVHIARFVDVLNALPITYRKSPKDRQRTLTQILAEAEAQGLKRGLSATTVNRNLDYLGQLLTKARGEGFTNAAMLDLNSLRPRKISRDRDERPAFTREDVQAIFRHPIWQGNLGANKWQEPGNSVIKNGLYWVPIIAAFTGARREEISALQVSDFVIVDSIPALNIHPNDNRGIKNFTSKRTIPLHPQLIDLGLPDHIDHEKRMNGAKADIFPDLRPRSGGKFGKKLQYKFHMLVEQQLRHEATGKVFHSFRHYVTTQLGRDKDVPERVQKDIVGHVGDSITQERYSETSTVAEKLDAISRLPYLPIKP